MMTILLYLHYSEVISRSIYWMTAADILQVSKNIKEAMLVFSACLFQLANSKRGVSSGCNPLWSCGSNANWGCTYMKQELVWKEAKQIFIRQWKTFGTHLCSQLVFCRSGFVKCWYNCLKSELKVSVHENSVVSQHETSVKEVKVVLCLFVKASEKKMEQNNRP